jgi:hypothetical protein
MPGGQFPGDLAWTYVEVRNGLCHRTPPMRTMPAGVFGLPCIVMVQGLLGAGLATSKKITKSAPGNR